MTAVTDRKALQYVYDYARLDRAPEGPTSAKVTPRRYLSGETLETAKSSTIGAGLFGSHIIMALVGQARGSGSKAHTHPNEQFNYILSGTMLAGYAIGVANSHSWVRNGSVYRTSRNCTFRADSHRATPSEVTAVSSTNSGRNRIGQDGANP